MDNFLDKIHKKSISDEVRRCNKEKKLQYESASQNSSFDTAYISGTVNNIEKIDVPKITNCTFSELSYEIEVIKDIVNSAMNSNTINDQSASEEIGKIVSLGYNWNTLENSEEIRKTVFLEYNWIASESLEEIKSKADYQDKLMVGLSIVIKFVQNLLKKLLLSDN